MERPTRNDKKDKKDKKDFKSVLRLKKSCGFCKKETLIDYKNTELLMRFISAKGKIASRRVSGNCAKHQRQLAGEIKLARFLSLVPYCD